MKTTPSAPDEPEEQEAADLAQLAPMFAEIERFEATLGLPAGFLEGLAGGDDWSQVIRSHAVMEAALGTVVGHSLGDRILPFFDTLTFAGGRASKLGMVEALDLLPESAIQFLRWHAEVRNRVVHDVKHLSFDFSDQVAQMSEKDLNRVGRAIAKVSVDSEDVAWVNLARELLRDTPKLAAFAGVCGVLARCLFRLDAGAYEKARTDAREAKGPLVVVAVVALLAMALLRSAQNEKSTGSELPETAGSPRPLPGPPHQLDDPPSPPPPPPPRPPSSGP